MSWRWAWPGLVTALVVSAIGCAHRPDHFAEAETYLRAGETQHGRVALTQGINDRCTSRTLPDATCDAAYLQAGDIASRAGDAPGAIPHFMSAAIRGQAGAKERLAIQNGKILAQQGPMESTIVVHQVNDIRPQLKLMKNRVWLDGNPITGETFASGPHWLAVSFEFQSTSPVVGRFTYRIFSTQFFQTSAGPTAITVRTYLDEAKKGPGQFSVKFDIVPAPGAAGQPRDGAAPRQ